MSIQSVEGAEELRRVTDEAKDGRDRLISAMGDAARVAGVSRQTAISWLKP